MSKPRSLETELLRHAWLNHNFGYNTTGELLHAMKNEAERLSQDGHAALTEALRARATPPIADALPTYDANIQRHLNAINRTRIQPIRLRYFQYLALLYTEICLDWTLNKRTAFLHHLNAFVQQRNADKAPGEPQHARFTDAELDKLAFWMATGAGKTLILHINYHQFRHYCQTPLDDILLITPNEALSEQHRRELANSDIPAERFQMHRNRIAHTHNAIQILEITKLVIQKTGEGDTIPVEAFEGNNLIFVDEGHKGTGGDVWRHLRQQLAQTGFTFEYSATFGQALAAAKNRERVEEYGKAIVFDYSYRHFYADGYGKDFRILNLKHDEHTQTETLLLANLLAFYQQHHYFTHNRDIAHTYGLDAPLWAFVGSKVNAVYTEKHTKRSDVLTVLRFLHRFLKNPHNWAIRTLAKILNGESGLTDENGTDVFANQFPLLSQLHKTPADIYTAILTEVFHTDTHGALHLSHIRNAPGEIALKATHGRQNFGLLYIGDTASFKKLVETDDAAIVFDTDNLITESLFTHINTPTSPINLLIGAKKFIEGWDSWRVTAMGLLNIGRQEGAQIIQLFGRGVRLRGKQMSLKRSSALDGEHPPHLRLLETLNIFAVRANFMAQFREYLTREGIPAEEPVHIEIPIKPNKDWLQAPLFVPEVPAYRDDAKDTCVPLAVNPGIYITHRTQTVEILQSRNTESIQDSTAQPAITHAHIPHDSLNLLNWEAIYLQLIEYKQQKQYHNLIFDTPTLKRIIAPDAGTYQLAIRDETDIIPTSLTELARVEQLVLTLLRKYLTKFYGTIQKRWSEHRIRLRILDEKDTNFTNWRVAISQNNAQELVPHLTALIEAGTIYGPDFTALPTAYNECHLYQPLLAEDNRTIERTTPPPLNASEKAFVEDMHRYIRKHHNRKQIVLLRNHSRGKGIGFYQNHGFYPDFILWMLHDGKQRIVFIEPHGLMHEAINPHNHKITLFKTLRHISDTRFRRQPVEMDAYIISSTDFTQMQKKCGLDKLTFEQWHILFPNPTDTTYLEPIFRQT